MQSSFSLSRESGLGGVVYEDRRRQNQYTVYDERNQEQFKVVEHKGGCTECITRQCLKDKRPFTLFVTHQGKRWLKIVRKYSCCLQEIRVYEDDDSRTRRCD